MGVAWVPESVSRLQRPGVVYRAVSGVALQAETSLVWREASSPVVARFVTHVQQRVQAGASAQQRQSPAARRKR